MSAVLAFWLGLADLPAFGACLLFPAFMVVLYLHCVCSGGPCLHLSRFRHVFFLTQQTCLLCVTADIAAVPHSRHVCCVTQQTCLLCHTADMSAVSRSRHVCCVTQQTCVLCHTAGKCQDTEQKASLKNKWSHRIPYKHQERTRTAFTPSWARPLLKTHEHRRDRNNMNEMCERRLDRSLLKISTQGRCNHVLGPSLYTHLSRSAIGIH